VVYARRGRFTVKKVRNNKSKIKVLSISMADAGIPTPDPEIEFRREVDMDDIGCLCHFYCIHVCGVYPVLFAHD
jgi:tellurite resistance-related uncharacterized protein